MFFQRTYRVLSCQVDVLNHLSNVQYHEFYKSAAFALLFENKLSELTYPKKVMPVVLNEYTEFFKEILFDEEIRVEITFSELSEKRNKIYLMGKIYNIDNVLASNWKCLVAAMNLETRKIEPFPDPAIEMLMQYHETSS